MTAGTQATAAAGDDEGSGGGEMRKRMEIATPTEWHGFEPAPRFLIWNDGAMVTDADYDRICAAVNEHDALHTEPAPLRRIEPRFAVGACEECLLFEWRNGDKHLAIFEDKDPTESLYHGLSKTEDIEFTTIYEAYAWLVAAPEGDGL